MASIATPSGTNTAGETYSLVCSVTVTGSTDQPTITWFGPMNNTVSSEIVNTTGSMSTLTFDPLSASHAGTYTCRATVGGLSDKSTFRVQVNIPGIFQEYVPLLERNGKDLVYNIMFNLMSFVLRLFPCTQ